MTQTVTRNPAKPAAATRAASTAAKDFRQISQRALASRPMRNARRVAVCITCRWSS